MKNYEKIEIG